MYRRLIPASSYVFGTLYCTTHPFNTVVRLRPDGDHAIVATAAQGVLGPTAAVLGRTAATAGQLFVSTDGGLFGSMIGSHQGQLRPALVALDVTSSISLGI